jgi:hypothetical protein
VGNPADHAFGLELELMELKEQRQRAAIQGREVDAAGLQRAIDGVKLELARTMDLLASVPDRPSLRAEHPRSA